MFQFIKHLLIDALGKRRDNLGWRTGTSQLSLPDNARIFIVQLDGKLGDTIFLSSIFPPLRRRYPSAHLAIVTTAEFLSYWQSNPFVNQVLEAPPRGGGLKRLLQLWRLGRSLRGAADAAILFEPFLTLDSILLIRAIAARYAIGFAKEHYRLFHISLHEHSFHWRKQSISRRVRDALAALGADESADLRGHMLLTSEGERAADEWISSGELVSSAQFNTPVDLSSPSDSPAPTDLPSPANSPSPGDSSSPGNSPSPANSSSPGDSHSPAHSPSTDRSPSPALRIFLNTYGAASERTLDPRNVLQIIDALARRLPGQSLAFYLNIPPGADPARFAPQASSPNANPSIHCLPSPMNLPLLFSLIDRMALVISPDTGVAHIAAAADVPQVVLYADKLFNPIVWKPLSDKLTALIPNSGTTVNDLPPDQIAAAAVQLIPARKEPMPAMS